MQSSGIHFEAAQIRGGCSAEPIRSRAGRVLLLNLDPGLNRVANWSDSFVAERNMLAYSMSVVAIATVARLPDSLYSTDALVEKLARGARFTAANSGVPDDFGECPTLMPLYGSQVCGRVGRSVAAHSPSGPLPLARQSARGAPPRWSTPPW